MAATTDDWTSEWVTANSPTGVSSVVTTSAATHTAPGSSTQTISGNSVDPYTGQVTINTPADIWATLDGYRTKRKRKNQVDPFDPFNQFNSSLEDALQSLNEWLSGLSSEPNVPIWKKVLGLQKTNPTPGMGLVPRGPQPFPGSTFDKNMLPVIGEIYDYDRSGVTHL